MMNACIGAKMKNDIRDYIFNVIKIRLYRYRISDYHHLADDLAQDAMIKVWKYGNGIKNKRYLYTVAKSVIAEYFRKNSIPKHHYRAVELTTESAISADPCSIDTCEIIKNLSDIMKMYIEGYKTAEIAKKYDMNINTVHTKIRRERKEINVLCRQI